MGLKLLAATTALIMAVAAGRAEAIGVIDDLVIDVTQVGSNVVISGSGAVDTDDLVYDFSTFQPAEVVPSLNTVLIGPDSGHVDVYSSITGPASLGTGGTTTPTSSSGDPFGIDDMTLDVPYQYVSGSLISGSSTFDNTTIAKLGFTPGTYVFTFDTDPITVNVSGGVPEPSTWAMTLLGFAGLGFVAYRKRAALAAA